MSEKRDLAREAIKRRSGGGKSRKTYKINIK